MVAKHDFPAFRFDKLLIRAADRQAAPKFAIQIDEAGRAPKLMAPGPLC